jgi:hypothetical protein
VLEAAEADLYGEHGGMVELWRERHDEHEPPNPDDGKLAISEKGWS